MPIAASHWAEPSAPYASVNACTTLSGIEAAAERRYAASPEAESGTPAKAASIPTFAAASEAALCAIFAELSSSCAHRESSEASRDSRSCTSASGRPEAAISVSLIVSNMVRNISDADTSDSELADSW